MQKRNEGRKTSNTWHFMQTTSQIAYVLVGGIQFWSAIDQ
jgi:hypothetical protein